MVSLNSIDGSSVVATVESFRTVLAPYTTSTATPSDSSTGPDRCRSATTVVVVSMVFS